VRQGSAGLHRPCWCGAAALRMPGCIQALVLVQVPRDDSWANILECRGVHQHMCQCFTAATIDQVHRCQLMHRCPQYAGGIWEQLRNWYSRQC
jgi:hypothetical protein